MSDEDITFKIDRDTRNDMTYENESTRDTTRGRISIREYDALRGKRQVNILQT